MQLVRPGVKINRKMLATYFVAASAAFAAIADALSGDYAAFVRDITIVGAAIGLPSAWFEGWTILVPDPADDPSPTPPRPASRKAA